MLARLSFDNAVKQFIMAVAAYSLCSFLPWILKRLPKLMKLGWLYTLIGIGMLAVVLLAGSEVFGAKNWLTIQNVTFQPSEFVKLTFIIVVLSVKMLVLKLSWYGSRISAFDISHCRIKGKVSRV